MEKETNFTSSIKHIEVKDLQLHAVAKRMPELEQSLYERLVEDVRLNGIRPGKVVVDGTNRVILGRDYLRAAKALQLAAVPCVVCEDGPYELVLVDLVQRPHYTKSAIAYLAFPLMEEALRESRDKRLQNLKKGLISPKVHSCTIGSAGSDRKEEDRFLSTVRKVEDLAAHLGISRRLFFDAQWCHQEFERDKKLYQFTVKGGAEDGGVKKQTIKEYFEPLLLKAPHGDEHGDGNRPIGFAAIKKALGWLREHKQGDPRTEPDQLELFTEGVETMCNRFSYWTQMDDQARDKAEQKILALADEKFDDPRVREDFGNWLIEIGKKVRKGIQVKDVEE